MFAIMLTIRVARSGLDVAWIAFAVGRLSESGAVVVTDCSVFVRYLSSDLVNDLFYDSISATKPFHLRWYLYPVNFYGLQ